MKALLVSMVALLIQAAPGFAGTSSGVGVPNPASVACGNAGAGNVGFEETAGQFGGCQFSDNGIIEAFTLLRQAYNGQEAAANAFLAAQWHGGSGAEATWADDYCTSLGAEISPATYTLKPSYEVHFCKFSDGSMIEAWTLFAGPSYYPTLAKALRAAAPASQTVTLGDTDANRTVTLSATQTLVVKLTNHGDGGYAWSVADNGGLGAPVHTQTAGNGIPGNFGNDLYTWSAAHRQAGLYTVRLIDKRPFGTDPGTPYVFYVNVTP